MLSHFSTRATKTTRPIYLIQQNDFAAFVKKKSKTAQKWSKTKGFVGRAGTHLVVPARDGTVAEIWLGVDEQTFLWDVAMLPTRLPQGAYRLAEDIPADDADRVCLGWAFGTYRFTRYKERTGRVATLVWPKNADKAEVTRLASATFLARDLVNTPAGDLGPAELAAAAQGIAKEHKAKCTVIVGDQLLAKNYPTIHMVGRAADKEPRLVDLTWGDKNHPKVTLVGKGVVFDSGGLDLKGASGMLLMKKDMGGAAMTLALAQAIMDAKLPVRLRALVPCVENAVSGDAMRPLDIVRTRKGITVEVGNTDAEGRLILCDALAEAVSEKPELVIDFATLTGAARVALGTEVPALFCNDDNLAADFMDAGVAVDDPVWRMPLVKAYRRHLESPIADISNVASGRYGGAITAALFLQEFVGNDVPWAHIDLMAYNLDERPGRPKGGEAMAIRAAYALLKKRYG